MKQQNSYSFFCCFCEEPRRKNNQKRRPFEGPNQIYKIDTNSYFSEKINPQIQQNNMNNNINNNINTNINNINTNILNIPPIENGKEKESIKQNDIKNEEFEEIKTIDSYHTINNKNKKENNIGKKEKINDHKSKYKNILQNDINSYLEKKERKEINIENLSAILKKHEPEIIKNISIQEEEKKTEEMKKDLLDKKENKDESQNKENKNNNNINLNNNINNDIKTDYNQKNNVFSSPSSIKMNEKENIVSQTIKKINKFEFEDNISQERLLWKNKNLNQNQKIKSSIINSNNINSNINQAQIPNNNIIDNSEQTSPNKSIQNETSDEKNTNPINKIPIENNNILEKEKEKEEIIFKKETINNKSNKSINNNSKKIKNENNTTFHQKGNPKFSTINNDANSFNSALELKANLSKIKFDSNNNKIEKNSEKQIDNKSKKELINNNIVNNEQNQEIIDNTNIIDSQSIKDNKSTNNKMSIKEGISIKLNYLTEFCPSNTAKEEKKEEESKTSNIQKESISEEIEDEVGSIDEFNNANDNRSILSSYVFSSVRPTESNKSFASSIYGRSDSQELVSNYNELMSNKGMGIIPVELKNNKEVEIRMDNLHRNSKNYFISMRMNEIKRKKEKINEKEKLIKNNYDNIDKMKKKIEIMDNEERQYQRWIEKEEEENENLIYLLNFLMNVNK